MLPVALNSNQTMSSLEIANLTGKEHSKVMSDIVRVFNEVEIDAAVFRVTYIDSQNRGQQSFNLPRRECDLIIAGYSAKYRLAIIDRWQELEAKEQPKPLTITELMVQQALALDTQAKKLESLSDAVNELQAKITSTPNDYYTVAGYWSLIGLQIDNIEAARVGKKAVKMSIEMDIPLGKAHSEKYGQVNTYHKNVLAAL